MAAGSLTAAQHEWDHRHAPPSECIRYSANC
ncbi:hypothetical protein [Streptomyces sp. NPDC047841]